MPQLICDCPFVIYSSYYILYITIIHHHHQIDVENLHSSLEGLDEMLE